MKTNKILFFDIDGTLLDEETQTIPQSTLDALKQAKDHNHKIIINTGRPKSSLEPFIYDLQPDGFVCGCGTYVEFKNTVLHHETIEPKRCKQLVDTLIKYKIDAILEGLHHVYFTPNIQHIDLQAVQQRHVDANFNINDIHDDVIQFDKFAMWFNTTVDIEGFKDTIKDFTYIVRDHDFGEIIPTTCSKATGMQVLLDHLNLNVVDSYAFGDSYNDLTMLEFAGTSIVMGNAKEDLKQKATFVTKKVDDDGIYYALKELQLI